jgi:hypothetical protein
VGPRIGLNGIEHREYENRGLYRNLNSPLGRLACSELQDRLVSQNKCKAVTAMHVFTGICYNTKLHQNTYMKEPLQFYLHVFVIEIFFLRKTFYTVGVR